MLHAGIKKIEDADLEVSCSWEAANKKRLDDTVTLSTGLKKREK
jgi:hypothetical protein